MTRESSRCALRPHICRNSCGDGVYYFLSVRLYVICKVKLESAMHKFEFDEGCEKWTRVLVNKYLWAVSPHYEFSDLFAECYEKFLKITDGRYDIKNQAHGMSLYMRAVTNRMRDIFKKCRARPRIQTEFKLPFTGEWMFLLEFSDDPQDQYAEIDLDEEMSPPLRRLFERSSWEANIKRCRYNQVNTIGQRETTNQLLCRLAGVDPNVYDLRSELQEFVAI